MNFHFIINLEKNAKKKTFSLVLLDLWTLLYSTLSAHMAKDRFRTVKTLDVRKSMKCN